MEFDHQHKKKEMRPMRVMKCDMFFLLLLLSYEERKKILLRLISYATEQDTYIQHLNTSI